MKKVECQNPIVSDLKKNNKRRYGTATSFKKIVKEGKKYCAWCGGKQVTGNRKYCDEICRDNCYAFTGPQSAHGLEYHLQTQDFKCIGCNFDYKPHLEEVCKKYTKRNVIVYSEDGRAVPWVFDKLKWRIEVVVGKDKKPEVDHIVPIALGGESIGFDNHQVLCNNCHKEKTKGDVSDIAKARRED